ncbi:hypothetical protein ACLKA6_017491 [Drosophila palustris]
MLPVGKRQTASGSQERADADRSSSLGSSRRFEGRGPPPDRNSSDRHNSHNATIDTGATSSFVSEELAVDVVRKDLNWEQHKGRSLEKAAQDQARHNNLRRRSWKLSVGDQVWLKEHHLSNAAEGFAAKLAPRFGGLYRVVDSCFTSDL